MEYKFLEGGEEMDDDIPIEQMFMADAIDQVIQ